MSLVEVAHEPGDGVIDHAASGRRYQSYYRDGQLRHRESLVSHKGEELTLCDYPMKYLVGSGRFSRTYLLEDQGFLVESPLTWYASPRAWGISPGYDVREHQGFHRTIVGACLYCHAGRLERVESNDEIVRVPEMAIGCERCHGAGSLHVAKWTDRAATAEASGDLTIVNPRRLPRDRAEAICHQCHLGGQTQIAVRGRSPAEFRPGLRWQDFAIDYGFESPGTGMSVVGHVEQLHASRCYQESDRLTCTTCHNPHATVAPGELVAYHRAICLSCHADSACGVVLAERTATNSNDCTACHMPQSPTDVPHVAFTHHRIGIHDPAAPQLAAAASFRRLAPILDVSHLPEIDRRRALGLAYVQYQRDHPQEDSGQLYLAEARPLIESTVAEGLVDAPLALAKSELAGAAGDHSAAEEWAKRTLSAEYLASKERSAALRLLAGFALKSGRIADATSELEQLTVLCRDPRDWFLLGVCRQRQGDAASAITAFERVLAIDPAPPETHEILAKLYLAQGQAERAQQSRDKAQRIRDAQRAGN